MIVTENMRNVRNGSYDQIWAVVRSLKNPGKTLIHVPELSPSLRLFWDYRNWAQQGIWNADTFENVYKPRFLARIATDPDAQEKLDELAALDAAGKRIALVCFCTDAQLCHRTLIAQILRDRGVQVVVH